MSPAASRAVQADPVCLDAVELARAAAVEECGAEAVGDHLDATADDERVVTHYFAANLAGYRGWRWAVTVARASRAKDVTIDEVVLLPGDGALLAPPWVPWQERLRPGDLGVGDILPTSAEDDRLVQSYAATLLVDADETLEDYESLFGWEFGRARVLSRLGRDDAADRWYSGDAGPAAPIAKAAPANCGSCGFWLHLGGSMGGAFGVCANEYAPDDGRVVSADHGCGAHSEAIVVPADVTRPAPPVDDESYDIVEVVAPPPEPATEELGHS